MTWPVIWLALFVASLAPSARLSAQESARAPAVAPQTITLGQAMQYAVDHYPTVRAALEQVEASRAGVSIAKSAYLPRLDAIWQSNRATANNVFGQLLPQSVIPAMSGPVLDSASAGSVWGSATGTLFSWQPFDFGVRAATVGGAEAAVARSRAGEALTRLDVQTAVATAFLTIVGAQRTVQAMQADVTRRELLGRVVHTLVDNQLRPGAEASRSDAEHAGRADDEYRDDRRHDANGARPGRGRGGDRTARACCDWRSRRRNGGDVDRAAFRVLACAAVGAGRVIVDGS